MATSTIPNVKALLEARLLADAAIGAAAVPVQVSYGVWHAGLDKEVVLLGDTRTDGENSASFGNGRRDEAYQLEVRVRVVAPAREPQKTVTERAFAITAAVENTVRTWGTESPAFGGTVASGGCMHWVLVVAVDHKELLHEASQERSAEVTIQLACKARI